MDASKSSISVAAVTLSMLLSTTASYGQSGQVAAVTSPPGSAPINAATVSCSELRENLQRAGTLTIVTQPRGWADTYYGPGVPQCEFWLKPKFSYVSANDGACGVGYTCVDRVTAGR